MEFNQYIIAFLTAAMVDYKLRKLSQPTPEIFIQPYTSFTREKEKKERNLCAINSQFLNLTYNPFNFSINPTVSLNLVGVQSDHKFSPHSTFLDYYMCLNSWIRS